MQPILGQTASSAIKPWNQLNKWENRQKYGTEQRIAEQWVTGENEKKIPVNNMTAQCINLWDTVKAELRGILIAVRAHIIKYQKGIK